MVTSRRGSMKATACVYNTVMILLYHTVSPRFTSAGAVRLFLFTPQEFAKCSLTINAVVH